MPIIVDCHVECDGCGVSRRFDMMRDPGGDLEWVIDPDGVSDSSWVIDPDDVLCAACVEERDNPTDECYSCWAEVSVDRLKECPLCYEALCPSCWKPEDHDCECEESEA